MAPARRVRQPHEATSPRNARHLSAPENKTPKAGRRTTTTPRKRKSRVEFAARAIVEEDETRYLIDWEGTDPATKQPYEPTWEPKANANDLLIESWEIEKQQHQETPAARNSDSIAVATAARDPSTDREPRGDTPQQTLEETPASPESQQAQTKGPAAVDTATAVSSPAPLVLEQEAREDQPEITPGIERALALQQAAVEKHQALKDPSVSAVAEPLTEQEARSDQQAILGTGKRSSSQASHQIAVRAARQATKEPYVSREDVEGWVLSVARGSPHHEPAEETGSRVSRQLTPLESSRETAFTHSQPTPSRTPGRRPEQPASDQPVVDEPSPVSLRSTPSAFSILDNIVVVPSPRILGSKQYAQFPSQRSEGIVTGREASSIARILNPIVPDSHSWRGSESYRPSNPHGVDYTQETSTSTTHESTIEEITQFQLGKRRRPIHDIDPIVDSSSPLHRKRARLSAEKSPASEQRSELDLAADQSQPSQITQTPDVNGTTPSSDAHSGAWVANKFGSQADVAASRPLEQEHSGFSQIGPVTQHLQAAARLTFPATYLNTQADATQLTNSTQSGSQVPLTPLRVMEAGSEESPAQNGSPPATTTPARTVAETDGSRPTRGRPLRAVIDLESADQTRSPSAIPDQLPAARQLGEGQISRMQIADFGPELHPTSMQSIEINVEPPPAADSPAGDRSSPLSEAPDYISEPSPPPEPFPNLDTAEYVVVLPSPASSTDAYRKHITAHADLIESFCSPKWPGDADTAKKAATLVQQLKNYVTHSDLENDEALTQQTQTASDVPLPLVADWDMTVSSKFNFLGHLLEALRNVEMHIVVTAESKPLLDILENFLRGKDIKLFRAHFDAAKAPPTGKSSVKVSLLQTSGDDSGTTLDPADIIISFDNTFDASDTRTKAMRIQPDKPQQIAPVVHLFVSYAIEHIERCLPAAVSGTDRLRQLLTTAAMYRKQAGRLHEGYPRPKQAAYVLANYYLMSRDGSTPPQGWPIPNADIIHAEVFSSESSSASEIEGAGFDAAVGQKRPMVDDRAADPKKRQRTAEPGADSSAAVTNFVMNSTRATDSTSGQEPRLFVEQRENDSGSMYSKAADEDAIAQLLELTNRNVNLTSALEGLQFRFEEQSKELSATRKEREAVKTQAAIFQKQVETRDSSITTLKDERAELRQQLQAANDALKSSSIPEVAELAAVRAALADAERERDRAKAQYKSLETTMDYTRTQYQQASGRAMELTGEASELRSRVAELEKRASGEAAKLKALSRDDRERAWREESERLRGTVQSLEVLAQRLQEEARAAKNQGRVTTRQGSMPPAAAAAAAVSAARSPRLAPLSRTGSPAPLGLGLGVGGSRLREAPKARGGE